MTVRSRSARAIRASAVALLAATPSPAAVAAAAPAPPELGGGLATPAAHPYDESTDGARDVAAALALGRREHRVVLIDLGANWCPDCRMLSGVLDEPAMRSWLAAHAVLVTVDVGRFDRNMDVPKRWGVTLRGIPSVLAIAPDGTLLDRADLTALDDDRAMSADAVARQIAAWTSSVPARS